MGEGGERKSVRRKRETVFGGINEFVQLRSFSDERKTSTICRQKRRVDNYVLDTGTARAFGARRIYDTISARAVYAHTRLIWCIINTTCARCADRSGFSPRDPRARRILTPLCAARGGGGTNEKKKKIGNEVLTGGVSRARTHTHIYVYVHTPRAI